MDTSILHFWECRQAALGYVLYNSAKSRLCFVFAGL